MAAVLVDIFSDLCILMLQNHEEKEPFGPGCRDYFWLICHLIDGITKEDVELSWEQVCFSGLGNN